MSAAPNERATDRRPDPWGEAEPDDFVVDTHGEPDEPGEGALTRETVEGGFEPRVLSDHEDKPLADEMADKLRVLEDAELRRKPER